MDGATRRRLVRVGTGIALFTALLATGCGSGAPPERTPLAANADTLAGEVPAELQGHLDAGNEAYRSGDYEGALGHYNDAVAMDPQLAAAWYGVGMAEEALGNTTSAEKARAEIHRLAPELPVVHPVGVAPPNPH